MTPIRFDIVVRNYQRVKSFTENAWKLGRLGPTDRVSFVTSSPSVEEETIIRQWAERSGVTLRYFSRENRGFGELARCEYFSGRIGGPDDLTDSRYIFSIQDHYLDSTSPWSFWGAELDFRMKGDVVPDNIVFDLDSIDARMQAEGCIAAFADRNNPCWFRIGDARHIAPCGGNFIVRTDQIARPETQKAIRHLVRVFDESYLWGLYAEFMWGRIFFHEGQPVLDLKRNRVFTKFEREDFYVAPDDVAFLRKRYGETLTGWTMRKYSRLRQVIGRAVRRLLP